MFQLQDYYKLCDLISREMKFISYSIQKSLKDIQSEKLIHILFLESMSNIISLQILGSSLCFLSPMRNILFLHPLLSIPKYLSRGWEILLYVEDGGGIYVYWLIMNRFFRFYGSSLFRDTLFELNFSLTTSSWLNNFLKRQHVGSQSYCNPRRKVVSQTLLGRALQTYPLTCPLVVLDTGWTFLNLKIIKIQFSPYHISYGVEGIDLERIQFHRNKACL